jgi:hypothetical protein
LFLADMGTNSANGMALLHALEPGRDLGAAVHRVELVGDEQRGNAGFEQLSTLASARVKLPASTTNRIRSTSPMAPITVLFSDLFSAVLCLVWKPGVSTNTNCVLPRVRMPVMRWRVVWALREVMLIFCPTSALSSVDLPTLGLPTMAIRPQRCAAPSAGASAARCRGGPAPRGLAADSSIASRSSVVFLHPSAVGRW